MIKNKFICSFCKSFKRIKWGDFNSLSKIYGEKSDIIECEKCGIFYTFPITNEKELSKIYSSNYHYRQNKLIDRLLSYYTMIVDLYPDTSLIKKYKTSGKILDIGAGRGDFLSQFSSKNYELWAYDPYISKNDLKQLSAKIGNRINSHKTLEEYPTQYFDIIILRNTIEYTTEFMSLLKSIRKLLRTNGILFIRTPNIDSADFKVFRTNWYAVRMPGHIVFFSNITLRKILTNLKFSVEYCMPIKRSFPLSLQRSVPLSYPYPVTIILSLLFSLVSPLIGKGGDVRVIATKDNISKV